MHYQWSITSYVYERHFSTDWSKLFLDITTRIRDTSHQSRASLWCLAKFCPSYSSKDVQFIWKCIGTLSLCHCTTQNCMQRPIAACTNLALIIQFLKCKNPLGRSWDTRKAMYHIKVYFLSISSCLHWTHVNWERKCPNHRTGKALWVVQVSKLDHRGKNLYIYIWQIHIVFWFWKK